MLREVRGVSTVLPWEDCWPWFGRVRLLAGSFYLREYISFHKISRPIIGIPASVLGSYIRYRFFVNCQTGSNSIATFSASFQPHSYVEHLHVPGVVYFEVKIESLRKLYCLEHLLRADLVHNSSKVESKRCSMVDVHQLQLLVKFQGK